MLYSEPAFLPVCGWFYHHLLVLLFCHNVSHVMDVYRDYRFSSISELVFQNIPYYYQTLKFREVLGNRYLFHYLVLEVI